MVYSSIGAQISLLVLLFSDLITTTDIQRRQNESPSSSLPIPTFTYGYYSQVYPNGEVTPAANPATTTSGTQASTTSGFGGQGGGSQASSANEAAPFTEKESFISDVCFPYIQRTERPDMNFPCNKLILDAGACYFGRGNEELLLHNENDTASSLRSDKDQLECFCAQGGPGQQFWQNTIYCSECHRLHGATEKDVREYFPVPSVKALSSAYCAQPSSNAKGMDAYRIMWASTAIVSLGTATEGKNVLGTSTDIGLYAASMTSSPSMTTSNARNSVIFSILPGTGLAPASRTGSPSKASSGKATISGAVAGILGVGWLGMATDGTSSPSPPSSIPQHLAVTGAGTSSSPIPDTTASSPSAACAHLSIETEDSAELPSVDVATSKGRLISISAAEASQGPSMTARSSSPAKRPASQMDGTNNGKSAEDVDMEDTLAQDVQHKRLNSPREPVKAQRKNSRNTPSRHKREMSLDPLAGDPPPPQGSPLPDRSRLAGTAVSNGVYHMPQSGASTKNGTSGAPPSSGVRAPELPSIDDQIDQVMQFANRPLQEGRKGFVISSAWLGRVLSRGTNSDTASKYGKEAAEGPVGPVDNSGIDMVIDQSIKDLKDEKGQPFIPLRPEVQMNDDFEILPEEAWDLIIRWYGLAQGSPIITRYCHNTSSSDTTENIQYELRPPIFTIVKIPDTSGGMTRQALDEKDALPIKILASRHKYFQSFLKEAKQGARIEMRRKVRVWRILGGLSTEARSGMITPAQSRSNSPALNTVTSVNPGKNLVLDVLSFAELQMGSERDLIEAKDETANENYNGHLTLDTVGLGQDSVVVLEEQIGGPAGGEWVAEAAISKAKANGVPISVTKSGTTKVQNTLRPKANTSRTVSPAPGGMITRGRARKDGRTRGTIGLSNLGNTCYMNSALQCIRSCEELSQYFLQERYKKELNPTNPLAHNGMVAKAYAALIREMYGDGTSYAFAPKAFKNVIGKYGPSFSGYGQQDSQEFLLFLLDGLQEDLNRIQKKPYIEKPDSTDEMVNNPVALREMAAKCWDIYKARNDSVITDLFAGMYKSTVVCPVCDKVSIIFDPFNNLTLQLPIENVWSRNFNYLPLHSPPYQLSVDIDKNSTFKTLKEMIASKTGADPRKLLLAEIYRCRFYKLFNDEDTIAEERIVENDILCVFELEDIPTNWPRPEKKVQKRSMHYMSNNQSEEEDLSDEDSPQFDKMLVVVYHRQTKPGMTRSQQQRTVFGVPALIILNREEVRDHDAIMRKVLASVEPMTTRDFLRESEEADESPEGSDTVLMSTEEGDSSSESKVHAQSVDSEDGMVDISMGEANHDPQASSRIRYPLSGSQGKPQAKILQPGSFITPEVRTLFELKYNSSGHTIPASFSSLSEDSKDYPTISSRMPPSAASRVENTQSQLQRRLQRIGRASPSSSDEDADERPAQSYQSETMLSGSDDDELPPVAQLMRPSQQGFSRFNKNTPRTKKGLITYSRKDKNRSSLSSRGEAEVEPELRTEPLIKPGEQIYVDWTVDGYEALFGGTQTQTRDDSESEMRGSPTWESVPERPDPELDEKRRMRAQRKKNGVTLNDCLDEFGRAEILSENDAWYCPRCKEHRRASKTFELWTAPDILVIHLKRFSSQGRLRDKLDVRVEFPVEGLDLSKRVASQEEGRSPIYDLYAVDNHYGGLGGGHYTAFAKNFYDGVWYEYNDSQVSRKQNPQAVVSSAAYLLFYRRRSEHPLGGPFFESLMSGTEESAANSQPTSRNASPTGEGKRLDDSSRIGSSSALHRVGAAHQAGGGGDGPTARRTGVDDELPGYSGRDLDGVHESTLETMDLDQGDEAIADIYAPLDQYVSADSQLRPSWSFTQLDNDESEQLQVVRAPVTSEDGSAENFFDGDSNKAASSPPSEVGDRLADFAEDEGTTSGAFGPAIRGETPIQVEAPMISDEDGPVAEVTPPAGDPYV
ncbi:MAG: hypothetical protein LQ348_001138 [Seirophora lacunosa]|nr:MAG: hypothetical protein LQ348_001138 [Seirophora lacunosa]